MPALDKPARGRAERLRVPADLSYVIAPFAGRLAGRIGSRLPIAAGLIIAGAGLALLTLAAEHSTYLVLLPSFLLWGIGLGILTPAVVAAAIAAVPSTRSGLA